MTLSLTINPEAQNLSPYQAKQPRPPEIASDNFFGSLMDFFDAINPLQHIPIVGSLYREFTGDTISTGAKLAGGALFGGPIGLVASIANMIIEQESGKDIAGNVFAAATGKYESANQLTSVASAE